MKLFQYIINKKIKSKQRLNFEFDKIFVINLIINLH